MLCLSVSDLSLSFGTVPVLENVSFSLEENDRLGIIGVNGCGKSTLFRLICGELEPTSGAVYLSKGKTVGILRQDDAFDASDSSGTVLERMVHAFPDLLAAEARMAELEADALKRGDEAAVREYTDLHDRYVRDGGLEFRARCTSILSRLGFDEVQRNQPVGTLSGGQRTRLALAVQLSREPDILMLDEPTNGLDMDAVLWLEDFLSDYFGTVLVVSHDRHFLNDVCTNIVDIDYNGIKMYVGNYEFWYESSQLIQRMMKQQNKKAEEKIKELQTFISRFSANKSKSRQATSRRKLLDKLTVEEMPASSRRYPFIGFDMDRVAGKDILFVRDLTKTVGGVTLFKNLSFTVNKDDKIALVGNEQSITALFRILVEEDTADSGEFKWGVSITKSYFPHDNTPYFKDCDLSIIEWLAQYSKETTETYLRGFLGRMLFSGDSVFKPVKVLSGGEKVRCMFSRMMLFGSNFLLLDQPTDHLDLESISAVNNGLSAFKGNVIFTSHDYELVNTVANRIIEITPDGMRDYSGTFEDFLARDRAADKDAMGKTF